jgi:hypothetical protein
MIAAASRSATANPATGNLKVMPTLSAGTRHGAPGPLTSAPGPRAALRYPVRRLPDLDPRELPRLLTLPCGFTRATVAPACTSAYSVVSDLLDRRRAL